MKLIYRLIFILVVTFFINSTIYAYTIYSVGDEVTYNNINYYVIKDSSSDDDSVTMLKSEPLTVDEVNQYGVGHVNRYTSSSKGTAYNNNGYGGMAYYTSETCGYSGCCYVEIGCKNDYASSEVKYVVDAWKTAKAPLASEARLISKDEYQEDCINEQYHSTPSSIDTRYIPQFDWMFNNDYNYWTNTSYADSSANLWGVSSDGYLKKFSVSSYYGLFGVVRPVITLKKTILGDEEKSIEEDNEDEGVIDNNPDEVLPDNKNSVDKKETTTKVKVENTYMSQTLIVMIIGFISICSGVVIYYLIKNKKIISRR